MSDLTADQKLLPCPFCGHSHIVRAKAGSRIAYAHCMKCGACGPDHTDEFHWNERKQFEPNWQPIETAPKDGSVVIGTNHFVSYHMAWSMERNCFVSRGFGLWARRPDGCFDEVKPMYWMPRPSNPTEQRPLSETSGAQYVQRKLGWHQSHNVQASLINEERDVCIRCGWTDIVGNDDRRAAPCAPSDPF